MAESSVMPTTSHTDNDSSKSGPTAGRFELCVRGEVELSLTALDGIGPKSAEALEERGIATSLDLLALFPNRYQRTAIYPDAELLAAEPEHVVLRGTVTSVRKPRRGTRQPLEVVISCDGVRLVLVWFHIPGSRFAHRFKLDSWLEAAGTVDYSRGLPRIVHPRITGASGPAADAPQTRWEPVYPAIEGVPARRLRAAIEQAFEALAPHLADVVPRRVYTSLDLGTIRAALGALHALEEQGSWEAAWARARDRIVYEEFYTLQRALALQHVELRARARAPRCAERNRSRRIVADLPFKLTGDQQRVLGQLAEDLSQPLPMRRLLQGDVGSGKTIVALVAAAIAMESGQQVALVAPTEVLAAQHLTTAQALLEPHGFDVSYLTGSLGAADRRKVLADLVGAEPRLIVGTHALFSEDVDYGALGLVIIDEQHKFGVEQRDALLAKGRDPHLLAMTATPIPRSLAHAVFGDLLLTAIRERPVGREPVRTYLRDKRSRPALYEWLQDKVVADGHQAFVVFPAIDQDARGFRALLDGAEELANGWLADCRLGVLHGQMGPQDKLAVMRRFAAGDVDVLCATTVIEVGVDVPNATVMVIESAEAFGLSQLHQLRGRVGRGSALSRCVLVRGDAASEIALERLRIFERTNDGFELAELDLQLRGPGEFLGVRQAGAAEFRFADLLRDSDLLEQARTDARREVFGDVSSARAEDRQKLDAPVK